MHSTEYRMAKSESNQGDSRPGKLYKAEEIIPYK